MHRIRRRASRGMAAIAAVGVLGSGIMLYPATAAWFSELTQSQLVVGYSQEIDAEGQAAQVQALEDARAYNGTLSGGAIVDPELERASDGSGDIAAEYRGLLSFDDRGIMARVQVPSIGVDLPVYHGTSEAVLQRGVGHLFGTALPVGGEGTHAVLTGHRGLPESTLFTNLDRVERGDLVQVQVAGELLTYRVFDTRVVEPSDTASLFPQRGADLLTLITCTPLGINSHRILVTAERVVNPPADSPELVMPDIPGPPWWAVGLALSFGTAAALLAGTSRPALVAIGSRHRADDHIIV